MDNVISVAGQTAHISRVAHSHGCHGDKKQLSPLLAVTVKESIKAQDF